MCNYIFLPVQRLGRKPKDQDTVKMFLENNKNKLKVFIDKNSLRRCATIYMAIKLMENKY